MKQSEDVREQVRQRYAAAASAVIAGSAASCGDTAAECCMPDDVIADGYAAEIASGAGLYSDTERDLLPEEAVRPAWAAATRSRSPNSAQGERVLDLGSGGGIDVLLSARRVGADRVRLRGGHDRRDARPWPGPTRPRPAPPTWSSSRAHIEDIPLPDASIDVVISNCVINLSTDKPAVLAEMFRVLRPGGRIGISDVVAEDHLTPAERAERGGYVGCIAGALSRGEYREGLATAGFTDVSITATQQVADGIHSAIIRANKP